MHQAAGVGAQASKLLISKSWFCQSILQFSLLSLNADLISDIFLDDGYYISLSIEL
jgi:hypothetical protein